MGCAGSKKQRHRSSAEIKVDLDIAVAAYQARIRSTSAEHPKDSKEVVDEAYSVLQLLSNRPERHGIHKSTLTKIEHEQKAVAPLCRLMPLQLGLFGQPTC